MGHVTIRRVWLKDFRSYEELELDFTPGLTALLGDNGNGKSNLLEAIGFLVSLKSFRGAPKEALVRAGVDVGFIRAELDDDGREVLIEVELKSLGSPRVLVNKQRLGATRELLGVCSTTIFSPDDLSIAKGSPSLRRELIDDLLTAVHPKNEVVCDDFAKVLKQRNALLKQCNGRLSSDAQLTLEVWDERLVEVGERLGGLRVRILEKLQPLVNDFYTRVADNSRPIGLAYSSAWRSSGMAASLAESRRDDLRRGISTVGPHRDDVMMEIDGMNARVQASQGEQRSLVLALRLASHELIRQATGTSPILLLDDVFSELDERRSASLLGALPKCQTILTSAVGIPKGATADAIHYLNDSRLVEARSS